MLRPPLFAELCALSNFSFLRGASHPEELVARASELGYRGLAVSDLSSLAGAVRVYEAGKNSQLPVHVGATLALRETLEVVPDEAEANVVLLPYSLQGYKNLSRLLSVGKQRTSKGGCALSYQDVFGLQRGLLFLLLPPPAGVGCRRGLEDLCSRFCEQLEDRSALALVMAQSYEPYAQSRVALIAEQGRRFGLPLLASNQVLYHVPERRLLQDVISCVRLHTTLASAGSRLMRNAERYLKSPEEISRLFSAFPEAIQNTLKFSERAAGFSFRELRYQYPAEVCPEGASPREYLRALALQGASERFPQGIPEKVRALLEEEFKLIGELQYEKYFLTCYDIVRHARSLGILCQGRGAAANSVVCFCLGITAVDPTRIDLLFARFISKERNEPPDIDIDFEHERREEVIQYIYGKYGRDRAALTAEVVTYQQRGALREVAKVFGLPLDAVNALAKAIHRWTGARLTDADLQQLGIDPADVTIRNVLLLSRELEGFPRHLSQHVGGFIISDAPLCEIVPIMPAAMPERTIIEWDKDDIEALGMLKIDVLALGMLSCIRKALALVNQTRSRQRELPYAFHEVPAEDPRVYEMLCKADSVGVFQIESRAQMSMLPRLKPRCFYDLVIEVAIVRPGPIHGNMVHPFLRRRAGLERVDFPDEMVRNILGKTLGVPIFQEQAMRLAIALAKFSPGEAEELRRAMAAWKRNKEKIASFKAKIISGMLAHGYSLEFAETCMHQIRGFSEYGFPESHAASFALLVYVSAWLKCYYPAEFAAALINSQPMGFYAPQQIINDAVAHGVSVLPIDVNRSAWDCSLEYGLFGPQKGVAQLRLGLRLVRGLAEQQGRAIASCVREKGEQPTITGLWASLQEQGLVARATLLRLAKADAFRSMGLDMRQALWEIEALPGVLSAAERSRGFEDRQYGEQVELPLQSRAEHVFEDIAATGLSLKGHLIELVRGRLTRDGVSTAAALAADAREGVLVSIAGICLVKQRPRTAKGVLFVTLEDETGVVNLLVSPPVFERYSRELISDTALLAKGRLQKVGPLPYLAVESVESLQELVFGRSDATARAVPVLSYSY